MKKLWMGFVCAGAILGCQSSTDTDGNTLALTQGLIMNSCGPADGAETRVLLSDRVLDCAAPRLPYLSVRIVDVNLSGLSVGKGQIYVDSLPQNCDTAGCKAAGLMKFQFLDSSSQGYRLQFEVEKDGKAGSTGTLRLKTCPEMIKCG